VRDTPIDPELARIRFDTLVGVRRARSVISDRSEESLIIVDEDGQTWQRRGAMWRVLTAEVTDPSFPLP